MREIEQPLREDYQPHTLSDRLVDIANRLNWVSENARDMAVSAALPGAMRECQFCIEWTAAELEPENCAELVDMQRYLGLWRKVWMESQLSPSLRTLLYLQARKWSERVRDFASLSQAA